MKIRETFKEEDDKIIIKKTHLALSGMMFTLVLRLLSARSYQVILTSYAVTGKEDTNGHDDALLV